MTVTALVSGGKDSVYAAYLAECQGWRVDELVTLEASDPDSMMFHTPNVGLVRLQADAWGKRHRAVPVEAADEASELGALRQAISGPSGPVVAGAIASSYQWSRLLRVADEVHRRVFVPLWRVQPPRVVAEEIDAGLDIRLVQVAAEPLTPDLLGRRLDMGLLAEIDRRSRALRRVNVAGEGGEYETLVVDAPFFSRRIELGTTRVEERGLQSRLVVEDARLVPRAPAAAGRS